MPSKLLSRNTGFLYKVAQKIAVSTCSFAHFSFPLNFWAVKAKALKFVTLPLNFLFFNTLLAIFDIFFVQELFTALHQKYAKTWHATMFLNHNFISKANLKIPEQSF